MKAEFRRQKDAARPLRRYWARSAVIALAAVTLAGCDYFGFTPIKDITAAPAQFEGKEVKIKGKATGITKLFGLRSFTVRDEGGEISVVTEGALPAENADVALKGRVKSTMIVSGKSLGLRVEETQRLR